MEQGNGQQSSEGSRREQAKDGDAGATVKRFCDCERVTETPPFVAYPKCEPKDRSWIHARTTSNGREQKLGSTVDPGKIHYVEAEPGEKRKPCQRLLRLTLHPQMSLYLGTELTSFSSYGPGSHRRQAHTFPQKPQATP